jgi:hypothetical protein
MIKIHKYNELGKGDYGWLKTSYHFSFSSYYNPQKVHMNNLRVLNDDYIAPNKGFDTHPHNNMEIITYIVEGKLTHVDSMGNKRTLGKSGVQYMSAGTGVYHSEFNNEDEVLHLYQIWIFPEEKELTPNYGDVQYDESDFTDKLRKIVSSKNDDGDIHIYQDSTIEIGKFSKETSLEILLKEKHSFYLVVIEGTVTIEGIVASKGDAIESDVSSEILVSKDSHILLIKTK